MAVWHFRIVVDDQVDVVLVAGRFGGGNQFRQKVDSGSRSHAAQYTRDELFLLPGRIHKSRLTRKPG